VKNPDYFLKGLQTKNEEVILEIYNTVFPKVSKFVINNSGNLEDAEDVFQKALMQIMARVTVRSFKIKSSFGAYLFTACKNLWRRELNKSKRMVTNSEFNEQVDESRDIARSALEQERREFFQEILERISENCKEILKRFFDKIPYSLIAKELNYKSDLVVRQM